MIKTNEYGMPLNFVKAVKCIKQGDRTIRMQPGQLGDQKVVKVFSDNAWNRITKQHTKHPQLNNDEGGFWEYVEHIPEPSADDVLSHEPTGGAELKAVKEAKAAAEASKPKK